MNKMKLTAATVAVLLALPSATLTAHAKTKTGKNKVEATSVLKSNKSSTRTIKSIVRRDGGVNKKRTLKSGRGPGFELGFDGHSGGL
jgi:MFS-type transporter involved in bile tolerance (Atg22 family)